MEVVVTSKQMKACDLYTIREMGMPSMVLMERAALAVKEVLMTEYRQYLDKILFVCGSGNNGADAVAIARMMYLEHINADVYLVGNEKHNTEEMKRQIAIAKSFGTSFVNNPNWDEYTTIVDGIFGVGLSRPVEGQYKEVICQINRSSGLVAAVDIPSGIDGSNGGVLGCAVKADVTVTFQFPKRGLLLYPGRAYAGKCYVKDVGIVVSPQCQVNMQHLLPEDLSSLPKRCPFGNKGTFGKVLTVAGSTGMAGAAYLSALASFYTGAGMVKFYTTETNRIPLQSLLPEAMIACYNEKDEQFVSLEEHFSWADVVVLGPGLGRTEQAKKLFCQVLSKWRGPLVLDGDALYFLAKMPEMLKNRETPAIITPHLGEMARLTGHSVEELKAELSDAAKEFAFVHHCICVCKDAVTILADSAGTLSINTTGTHGMASAGSGDVLSGIIGGLLAQNTEAYQAAKLGVLLHGLAGERAAKRKGNASMLAGDIAAALSEILKEQEERYNRGIENE